MAEHRRRRWRWPRDVLAAAALLALAACARNAPQDTLKPAGEVARKIDRLFDASFWMATAVFVIVEGLLVFAIIRFRQRPGKEPRQVHGATGLEIGWTIVPALMLAGLAIPTVALIFDLAEPAKGRDVVEVEVIGHQWWWEYRYPDLGIVTANELHIPVRRPVNLRLTSEDVIHSFWVPRLAGKLDVVPGRHNLLTLAADEPGVYSGQCAEYCGLSHANMRLRVIAQSEEDFARWVEEQRREAIRPTAGLAAQGFELFATKGCVACHTIRGYEGAVGKVGPDLTHLQSRGMFAGAIFDLTPDNLRRWLADPPGMKPMQPDRVGPTGDPLGMPNLNLTPDEIEALVAYLSTLK